MGKRPQDLTISQVADRIGVSVDTVKRRLKRGEYTGAYREPTPQGFRWKIPLSDLDLDDQDQQDPTQGATGSTQTGDQGQQDPQITQQLIDTLQRELDIRNREIERLHIVIAQQSAAISDQATTIAALPEQVPDRQGRPQQGDQGRQDSPIEERAQDAPAGLWRRLWQAISGNRKEN